MARVAVVAGGVCGLPLPSLVRFSMGCWRVRWLGLWSPASVLGPFLYGLLAGSVLVVPPLRLLVVGLVPPLPASPTA